MIATNCYHYQGKGKTMKRGMIIKTSMVTLALGASLALPALLLGADEKAPEATQTIKGEVVDLMCYLDHGAAGGGFRQGDRAGRARVGSQAGGGTLKGGESDRSYQGERGWFGRAVQRGSDGGGLVRNQRAGAGGERDGSGVGRYAYGRWNGQLGRGSVGERDHGAAGSGFRQGDRAGGARVGGQTGGGALKGGESDRSQQGERGWFGRAVQRGSDSGGLVRNQNAGAGGERGGSGVGRHAYGSWNGQ